MCPDVAVGDTVVPIEVDVAEDTCAWPTLNVTRLCVVVVWKLVPVTVTAVPSTPMAGEIPLIVGAELTATVNDVLLVADPVGVVTAIVPVVAPDGSVVTISVVVDDVTVAAVP